MIEGLILSLQFLTRIPLKVNIDFNSKNISRSIFFYPFIGMLIGLISYIPLIFINKINRELLALLSLLILILITGGLHIDGLADTCDGFFSSRDREKVFEIMKDSRAGTFGVIAIVLDLLLKYITIKNLGNNLTPLLLSMGNARLIAAFLISYTTPARRGGLGDLFIESKPRKFAVLGGIIYLIISISLGLKFLIPLIISIAAAALITKKSYNIIGGMTGDVFGASIEIVEIVSLTSFLGVISWI